MKPNALPTEHGRLNPFLLPTPTPKSSSAPSVVETDSSFNPGQSGSDPSSLITFRPYQAKAFHNKTDGIQVWLWGRQTGKSFTLAAWAVDRLITNPGRTVTILSNSKFNGAELNLKCALICRLLGHAFEQVDLSPDDKFETMRFETRVHLHGQTGRILVLAANPLTARSFSGDLILDEFAFHVNSAEIWKAAHPILASNKDFLCRIASTPNGKYNEFYRKATDPAIPLIKVTRTDAYAQGCPIFHPVTRASITPEEARALDPNKRDYDQNFECVFEDENMALLTYELINAAERPNLGLICDHDWSAESLSFLEGRASSLRARRQEPLSAESAKSAVEPPYSPFPPVGNLQPAFCNPQLFVGVDVGRSVDRTVISVLERIGNLYLLRAMLRLHDMRLPDQQQRLEQILRLPGVRACKIDMTGLGLGLYEYTHQKFPNLIEGINFSSTISLASLSSPSPRWGEGRGEVRPSVRITEHLATHLLQTFEDRAIQIPIDNTLREDLRKPERLVTSSGRVSIAATRDEAGHADHFWSLALALNAAQSPPRQPFTYYSWLPKARRRLARI